MPNTVKKIAKGFNVASTVTMALAAIAKLFIKKPVDAAKADDIASKVATGEATVGSILDSLNEENNGG